MTNDEVRILMERILLIPVAEIDAAMVLAVIEERLRNESRPTTGAGDLATPSDSKVSGDNTPSA